MDSIATSISDVRDMFALGNRYLITWVFIYDNDKDDCDALVEKLRQFDLSEVSECPTAILYLDAVALSWVGQLMQHAKRPVLMILSNGLCLDKVYCDDDFGLKMNRALDVVRQLKTAWIRSVT